VICKYPCGVCGKDVGRNSLCTSCEKWIHKRCSGVKEVFRRRVHPLNEKRARKDHR
jgi:hypothetical protein